MIVGMANAGPLKLTDTQMDMVTAGGLILPSGTSVFVGFDNAAPGDDHPYFAHPITLIPNLRHGRTMSGNIGPWSAHQNSDVIECTTGC